MESETFTIDHDGTQIPVRYTDQALQDFEERRVGLMDREIRMLSDQLYGREFYLRRQNRLGVLAPVMYDAIQKGDEKQIVLCVLWLAARFPEITGVEVHEGHVQFLWDESRAQQQVESEAQPEYLH